VRGIHFADVPPSQAKYITVLTGSLIDYVVDVRVGSPTFGQWDSVLLDTVDRRAVYLPEGMGHAFAALEDHTTAMYLVTAPYAPSREHGIHPLDPEVGLTLPEGMDRPLLSPKDASAPTLAEALEQGLLPSYAACRQFYDSGW
jgi:dTDP-4-dehydrorhamnose 3,5-epimerase